MRVSIYLVMTLLLLMPVAAGASASPEAIAVLNAEQRWVAAIARHDPRALGAVLAGEFVHVNYRGRVTYRADELTGVRKPKSYVQKTGEQTVDFFGPVAIVHGVNQIVQAGKVVLRLRYTDVYVLRAGRWQAVSAQETAIDDPAARARAAQERATRALVAAAASAAAAAASATASPSAQPEAGLGSQTWTLVEVSGMGVEQPDSRSLQFDAGARHVSGSAGCNRFSGSYESTGTSLRFGALATTRMMCPAAAMTGETTFLNALAAVRSFSFEDGKLGLFDGTGTLVARFTTAAP